ncbi:hypothetical protein DID88_002424 [Monilinia fructigena]|uniref:Uncharacterized protein n=1 Tax=Monilinia fructigena TaxID=38457 RepID=A0A395INP4_9HELO|nr:hypothetical protein DID88_002424 [Monilinia fructigena]
MDWIVIFGVFAWSEMHSSFLGRIKRKGKNVYFSSVCPENRLLRVDFGRKGEPNELHFSASLSSSIRYLSIARVVCHR